MITEPNFTTGNYETESPRGIGDEPSRGETAAMGGVPCICGHEGRTHRNLRGACIECACPWLIGVQSQRWTEIERDEWKRMYERGQAR